MVNCREACAGVTSDPANGILPRCLFYEAHSGNAGTIVIGMNPGRTTKKESRCYLERGPSYLSTVQFWESEIRDQHRFYTNIRELIEKSGHTGPILWTELAKCESAAGHKGALPLQTYRNCVHKHLRKEMQLAPKSWTVFAIGRDAFTAAAYLLSDRNVIGVPHPTGSRGHFPRLFKRGKKLRSSIASMIQAVRESKQPGAVWLSEK